MSIRRQHRPRSSARPARLRAALAVLALGLLAAGCGAVQSDDPATAERPRVAAVQQLEPAGPTRADEYRATATALAAESAARRAAEQDGPETEQLADVVRRLQMPAANRVQIPALGIDAPVEEVSTTLRDGELIWEVIDDIVGHHHASANPGEPGNIVLTGHVESRSGGNVFLKLPDIQVGDEVIVTSPAGEFRYVVRSVDIRHESEVGVLAHGYEEKVTLITCVNDGIFDHRVVVTAYPVDMAASSG